MMQMCYAEHFLIKVYESAVCVGCWDILSEIRVSDIV